MYITRRQLSSVPVKETLLCKVTINKNYLKKILHTMNAIIISTILRYAMNGERDKIVGELQLLRSLLLFSLYSVEKATNDL